MVDPFAITKNEILAATVFLKLFRTGGIKVVTVAMPTNKIKKEGQFAKKPYNKTTKEVDIPTIDILLPNLILCAVSRSVIESIPKFRKSFNRCINYLSHFLRLNLLILP